MNEIEKEQDTHMTNTIAISNFEGGDPKIVSADSYKICVPTRKCVQFWAQILACFITALVGIVLVIMSFFIPPTIATTSNNETMILPTSIIMDVGLSFFFLGFGILVPTPYTPQSSISASTKF